MQNELKNLYNYKNVPNQLSPTDLNRTKKLIQRLIIVKYDIKGLKANQRKK